MKNWLGKKWFKVGYLPSGEDIFCSEDGEHIKRSLDFDFVVEMSEEEMKSVMPERGKYASNK